MQLFGVKQRPEIKIVPMEQQGGVDQATLNEIERSCERPANTTKPTSSVFVEYENRSMDIRTVVA